jgi:hypothetical protein
MRASRGRTDPRFYLTAAPLDRVEIPTLFQTDGVVETLEEPPTLRPPTVGWDLWTLDTPHHVEGKKTFLANGYRKRLALFSGGTLTFVASCIEFLGWPRTPMQFVADPALNGLGLVELTLNFTMTVGVTREYMEPPPDRLRLWGGFRDLTLSSGARVYLDAAGRYVAPASSHDLPVVELDWSDDFAEAAAYELVLQAHTWFGVDPAGLAFVDHERRVLDPAALLDHLSGSGLSALAAGEA